MISQSQIRALPCGQGSWVHGMVHAGVQQNQGLRGAVPCGASCQSTSASLGFFGAVYSEAFGCANFS